MIEKKAKSYFQKWEAQSLLDKKGALIVGSQTESITLKVFLVIVAIAVVFCLLSEYIVFVITLAIAVFLVTNQSADHFVFSVDGFAGPKGIKYSYRDISLITEGSSCEIIGKDHRFVTHKYIQINVKNEILTINDDLNNYNIVLPFLRDLSVTKELDNTYYHSMTMLFSLILSTGPIDDSFHCLGMDFVKQYMSESSYKNYDYEREISSFMNYYDPRKDYININKIGQSLKQKRVKYEDLLELMSALFGCAYSYDHYIDDNELTCLDKIAHALGIRKLDFNLLKCRYIKEKREESKQKGSEDYSKWGDEYNKTVSTLFKSACALLNVKETASLEEIKNAYRAKVKLCHPDTLSANASEKEREEAAEEFRALTEAYDFLCGEVGANAIRPYGSS